MTPTPDRDAVLAALREACEREACVLAAYLGGSDATGRTDEWSDVDLVAIAEDGHAEAAMGALRACLARFGPFELEHRMPEPAWHGMSQAFWVPAGAPDWLIADVCVAERSRPPALTQRERHGEPLIWFDPLGLVRVTALDPGAHAGVVADAAAQARAMLGLGARLVRKAAARGHAGEASAVYHRLVLGQAVTLARCAHCPERHDFGLRYLDRDVPAGVRARIERLAIPKDLDALLAGTRECEAWAGELAAAREGARGREPQA